MSQAAQAPAPKRALEGVTWMTLSAELALAYIVRCMEKEGQVISFTRLKERFLAARPNCDKRTFSMCIDILTDQGFLEDKWVRDPESNGSCHAFYVYDPAEGFADKIVEEVSEMPGAPPMGAVVQLAAATDKGCGKKIGSSSKACGYEGFACSACLKPRK